MSDWPWVLGGPVFRHSRLGEEKCGEKGISGGGSGRTRNVGLIEETWNEPPRAGCSFFAAPDGERSPRDRRSTEFESVSPGTLVIDCDTPNVNAGQALARMVGVAAPVSGAVGSPERLNKADEDHRSCLDPHSAVRA